MFKYLSTKCPSSQPIYSLRKGLLEKPSHCFRLQDHRRYTYPASEKGIEALADKYDAQRVSNNRCMWWKERGLFAPIGRDDCNKFSLLLPPPNVTGTLHLGHTLTATIQDVLVKWRRMCGDNVLWIPGTDHAGIATQVIVEKNLERLGHNRYFLGREQFLKEVTTWQKKNTGAIDAQLKQLGCSLHWPQYYFTMDEKRTYAVQEAFIRLFQSNLIYRKSALVHWCCHLESTISDIEVDKRKIDGRTPCYVPGYDNFVEFGTLTKFAYKVCDKDDEVVVATTRPETMFADVAVAVHPSDVRYSSLRGSQLWHPYRKTKIPLIFDESVDPEFGTGAVKITPGHSFVDYEIAERHSLNMLTCITEKGHMTDLCGTFAGMKRFDARKRLLDDLTERDLLRGVEDHSMELPICSRTGDVLEVLLKPQWFIKTEEMAKEALHAVESGELVIDPSRYADEWHRWLSNIRDWCISRQLWWGHRIPVFRDTQEEGDNPTWVAAHNEEAAKRLFGRDKDSGSAIYQDEDVLDTWFSSSLLPFSSLGWPSETKELQTYFPLNMMVTGHDILFFWAARMVMLGKHLTGVLPFKKLLLHSIVCDSRNKKMSKSLGNVITPENIIEGTSLESLHRQVDTAVELSSISKSEGEEMKKIQSQDFPSGIPACGVDSLRLSLCSSDLRNSFMSFYLPTYETNLHFCNKLWQACRFFKGAMEKIKHSDVKPKLELLSLNTIDHWILSCLASLVKHLESNLESAKLDVCVNALQVFLRNQLCDVYIEVCKTRLAGRPEERLAALATLAACINTYLVLLTPFAPYLTEELYQHMLWRKNSCESVLSEPYPRFNEWEQWFNPQLQGEMQVVLDIVKAIRDIKQRSGVTNAEECNVTIETSKPALDQMIPQMTEVFSRLSRCQINKVILREKINTSKHSANEAVIDDGVLVRVNITDFLVKRGAHERREKITSLLRREKKLAENLSDVQSRLEQGRNQGKIYNENHHLNIKLTEWSKQLQSVRLNIEIMKEDLKSRNEPVPTDVSSVENKSVKEKKLKTAAPP